MRAGKLAFVLSHGGGAKSDDWAAKRTREGGRRVDRESATALGDAPLFGDCLRNWSAQVPLDLFVALYVRR
jgi:hypothetical protein